MLEAFYDFVSKFIAVNRWSNNQHLRLGYSSNLYYFKDRIVNTAASIPLECAPVGNVIVTITPSMGSFVATVQNNSLVFNPAIPAGRTNYNTSVHATKMT